MSESTPAARAFLMLAPFVNDGQCLSPSLGLHTTAGRRLGAAIHD